MPASVASGLSTAGGVAGLMKMMPSEARLEREGRRYRSLADPIRLKILWALREMDLCPCVLKIIADVTDSKLTYHLKVLESEKLVRARRKGNWRLYSITDEGKGSIERDDLKHI